MKIKRKLTKITELEEGDLFSFRTLMRPIWWRFIEIKEGEIIYEEIRSKYRHSSTFVDSIVLKRILIK